MSKTIGTVYAYLSRGRQLWKRSANDYGCAQNELAPKAFLGWLEDLLPTLRADSRRQYIAASKAYLSVVLSQEFNVATDQLQEVIGYLGRMKADGYQNLELTVKQSKGQTSNQKSKHCEDNVLTAIVNTGQQMRGRWIEFALIWLAANRLVGLRPCEWRTARLIESDQEVKLIVNNAKNTNGRANGAIRTLDIIALKPEEMQLIKQQLNAVAMHATDRHWNAYYAGSRKAMYRIARKALGNQDQYPTLYSTRHQFAADLKSAGASAQTIAALMGHAVDDTASVHYGLKRYGRGGCGVKPNDSEVATVKVAAPRTSIHQKIKDQKHASIAHAAQP